MTSQEAAAWVQAVGSVIAILIAIAIPAAQHWIAQKRERDQAALRARSLGLAVLPELEAIAERLNKVWADEHPDSIPEAIRHPHHADLGPRTMQALEITDGMRSRVDSLHELGRASDPALRCIHHLVQARSWITTGDRIGHHVTFNSSAFYDHLAEASVQCMHACGIIEGGFPAPTRPPIMEVTDHLNAPH